MSDYDKKARLERDQERKDFLTVINNLRTTFGQAFAAEGAVGHDAASAPPTPSGAGRPTPDRPINVSGLGKDGARYHTSRFRHKENKMG